MKTIKNLRNKIDFFLRKSIRFSREYKEKNESKENLFDYLPDEKKFIAQKKEKLYFEKYCLDQLKNNSTLRNYLENLATIELLENHIKVDRKTPKVLDIGSKNWFYAAGQYNFFKYNNFEKEIRLDGIEIDAFRVYSNFYTRRDYALYYSKGLKNCRYICGDLLNHQEKYDYIIWFFPFVTEMPLLEWGLPLKVFKPSEMLQHAAGLLNPGGMILTVNQDKDEYLIQQELIKKLQLNYKKKGKFNNSFLEYKHNRYVTLIHSGEF